MKILQRNQKQGTVTLVVETPDDLWYLRTIVDPGDACTGESEYKEKLSAPEGRAKSVRRRVWVRLRAERAVLEHGMVRISGIVIDGSEDVPRGSHHTLDIEPGAQLELGKDAWLDYHVEKLDEAVKGTHMRTLLVLFDREQALFALLRPNGHEVLLTLKGDVPKKGMDEGKTRSFYHDIIAHLKEYDARLGTQRIIAASPSFWKEYLQKELPAELKGKVIFAPVSAVDESAIGELLRRPELQQALEGERAARELALIETLMLALAKDRLAYGLQDVDAAVREGNVKELAVTERMIDAARQADGFAALDAVMKAASGIGARIHLISTQECTRKLDGLGGIAGVKRW